MAGLVGVRIAAAVLYGTAAVMAATQASAQQAHDYWAFFISDDSTLISYVDAASITSITSDVKRAWTWIFYSKSAPQFSGYRQLELMEVNCHSREFHSLQMDVYDGQNQYNTYLSGKRSAPWTYVTPETMGEAGFRIICSGVPARPRIFNADSTAVRLPEGVTPEQHAQLFFDAQKQTQSASSAASANQ